LDTSHDIILPGTLVNCSIIIDSVTPLEYVARMVNTGFNR